MIIRVVKCDKWYWYRNYIGSVFEVESNKDLNINTGFTYKTLDKVKVIGGPGYFEWCDVEELSADDVLDIRKQEFKKMMMGKNSIFVPSSCPRFPLVIKSYNPIISAESWSPS